MPTIYLRETGEALECSSVDAREILEQSPDLYVAADPEPGPTPTQAQGVEPKMVGSRSAPIDGGPKPAPAKAAQRAPEPPVTAPAAEEPAPAPDFNGADPAKFDHDDDGKPGGSKPAPEPVGEPIPSNWRDLHWTQRVKLAKSLGAPDDIDTHGAEAFIASKE
jgi:hypothetical protein